MPAKWVGARLLENIVEVTALMKKLLPIRQRIATKEKRKKMKCQKKTIEETKLSFYDKYLSNIIST